MNSQANAIDTLPGSTMLALNAGAFQFPQAINIDPLPESTLLDTKQAAAVLGLAPTTLQIWRSTGRVSLRYIKCGRLARYRVGDIKAFINRRSHGEVPGAV